MTCDTCSGCDSGVDKGCEERSLDDDGSDDDSAIASGVTDGCPSNGLLTSASPTPPTFLISPAPCHDDDDKNGEEQDEDDEDDDEDEDDEYGATARSLSEKWRTLPAPSTTAGAWASNRGGVVTICSRAE